MIKRVDQPIEGRIHACLLALALLVPFVATAVLNEYRKTELYGIRTDMQALVAFAGLSATFRGDFSRTYRDPNELMIQIDLATTRDEPDSRSHLTPFKGDVPSQRRNHFLENLHPSVVDDILNVIEKIEDIPRVVEGYERRLKIEEERERKIREQGNVPIPGITTVDYDPPGRLISSHRNIVSVDPIFANSLWRVYAHEPEKVERVIGYGGSNVSTNTTIDALINSIRKRMKTNLTVYAVTGIELNSVEIHDRARSPSGPIYSTEIALNRPCDQMIMFTFTSSDLEFDYPLILQDIITANIECVVFGDLTDLDMIMANGGSETLSQTLRNVVTNRAEEYVNIYGSMEATSALKLIENAIFTSYNDFKIFGLSFRSTQVTHFVNGTILFLSLLVFYNARLARRDRIQLDFRNSDKVFSSLLERPVPFALSLGVLPLLLIFFASPLFFYYVEADKFAEFSSILTAVVAVAVYHYCEKIVFGDCGIIGLLRAMK